MNTKKVSNSSWLAEFISKSKYFFIALLLAIIIGTALYVVFKSLNDKKSIEVLSVLEEHQQEYEDLFNEYNFYDEINESLTTKAENLLAAYNLITENYSNVFGVQDAYYKKSLIYILLKDYNKALSELTATLENSKKSSYLVPKILSNLAAVSEELDMFENAEEYYRQIIDNHSTSIEAPHALLSLGRLAEIKDTSTGNSTAQGYYLSLIQDDTWKDSSWASLAKSRLAMLGYTDYSDVQQDN